MIDSTPDLAQELGTIFRSGEIRELPFDLIPDAEAAYAVQENAVAASGLRRVGYKVGATSVQAQQFLGCEEPVFGPIFAERLLLSGAELALPESLLGLECEFGFLLGRDLSGEPDAIDENSVAASVAECFPAIEIAARRCPPGSAVNEVSTIADFCMAFAVMRGAPIPDWRERDLAATAVTLLRDGEEVASGNGARVLGHPVAPLVWLARTLARSGRPLTAGDMVVTGSCTGVTPAQPGEKFSARFEGLPSVELATTPRSR